MSNEAPSELIEDERIIGMIVEAAAAIDAADFERLPVGDDLSELLATQYLTALR